MPCSPRTAARARRGFRGRGERLAREVTVMATFDEAPEGVRQWLEAGADEIDVVLPPGLPEEQHREMLEAAAPISG